MPDDLYYDNLLSYYGQQKQRVRRLWIKGDMLCDWFSEWKIGHGYKIPAKNGSKIS